ncbi:MAG: hypothetical protein SNJ64_06795 [Endomicrobiia bacterium]
MNTPKKLCIFLHQIGHYHHARFMELTKTFNLTAVEIRAESNEYFWQNEQYIKPAYTTFKTKNYKFRNFR